MNNSRQLKLRVNEDNDRKWVPHYYGGVLSFNIYFRIEPLIGFWKFVNLIDSLAIMHLLDTK